MYYSLYQAFSSIKSEKDFNNFLTDLCTPEEIKNLNDRFKIAQMLNDKKKSQKLISEELKCSITTVTRVARFLNKESYGGYRKVIKELKKEKK